MSQEYARRIKSLDGLRGVAALGVVLGHARLVYLQNTPGAWVDMPGIRQLIDLIGVWGSTAVWLFFVLSGFVLALSFQRADGLDYGVYIMRRLARLYLPVWGAVLFALGTMVFVSRDVAGLGDWVSAHPTSPTPWGVIADVTLLSGTGSNVTPLWSLRWEVLFSLLLVVYIAAARRVRPGWLIAACLVLSTVGGIYQSPVLLYMPMFGIGVGFALAWRSFQRRADAFRNALKAPIRRILVATVVVVLAAAQAAPALLVKAGVTSSIVVPGVTTVTRLISVSLIIVIIGTSLSMSRAFASPVILWFGTISFSLYLTHETVLLAMVYSTRANTFALAAAVALCIPVAWGFYKAVEAPAHKLARRIGSTSHRRTVATPAHPTG